VRHRAGGDGKIKESKQVADPQAKADARRIDDGIAQCPQILRPGGKRCGLRFLQQQIPVPPRQHAAPSTWRLYPISVPFSPRRQEAAVLVHAVDQAVGDVDAIASA
jgi:hypothetical protein